MMDLLLKYVCLHLHNLLHLRHLAKTVVHILLMLLLEFGCLCVQFAVRFQKASILTTPLS